MFFFFLYSFPFSNKVLAAAVVMLMVEMVCWCVQESGQCHCKPNVCSGTCSTCKDGFFNLQERDYFGCRGERCSEHSGTGVLFQLLTCCFFRVSV